MTDWLSGEIVAAFFQVIVIDLVLAGDNAIVIGLAAAGLPRALRVKAIFIGIVAATVLRILLASVTTQLLQIVGLLLAGGILLLWVCWKMWRELHVSMHLGAEEGAEEGSDGADDRAVGFRQTKTFGAAAWQIVVADISMSLDNVLAVAGAAREHPWVLVFGLALSVALMGCAAGLVAQILQRHRWLAFVGLAVVLYVALEMIYRGFFEVWPMVDDAMAQVL